MAPSDAAGRPRDLVVRTAVLDAAWDLVAESGYAAATVERIAARSGSAKTTIYRWWAGRADVVMEALADRASRRIVPPQTGDLPTRIRDFLSATYAMGHDPVVISILKGLMAEAQINEAFGVRFRDEFLASRRQAFREALGDRGGAEGFAGAAEGAGEGAGEGLAIDLDLAVDLVFGTLWYRVLAGHAPLDDLLVAGLVDVLTRPDRA